VLGAVRREAIAAFLKSWLTSLTDKDVPDPKSYLERMLAETGFLREIREHTADLHDEVAGLADGAGQPFDLMFAAQCMDEEWAYRRRIGIHAPAKEKCSTIAVRCSLGVRWVGQNMDLGEYTDGHQLLMHLVPESHDPPALVFTVDGMIGLMGVNARGVAICVNSLPQLPARGEGVPVAFVVRRLLRCSTAHEAANVVQRIPHATGQHYLIADPTELRSFEASGEEVVEFHSPHSNLVLHTNHPLSSARVDPSVALDERSSRARLQCLESRLSKGSPGLRALMDALSSADHPDYPVCRQPKFREQGVTGFASTTFTTGSMICSLQPTSNVECWVHAGPPTAQGYSRYVPGFFGSAPEHPCHPSP
jgi:hypothetical protein